MGMRGGTADLKVASVDLTMEGSCAIHVEVFSYHPSNVCERCWVYALNGGDRAFTECGSPSIRQDRPIVSEGVLGESSDTADV